MVVRRWTCLSLCFVWALFIADARPARAEDAPAEKPAKVVAEPAEPAAGHDNAETKEDDSYELYQIFVDTLDQVERNYVKPVSRRELMEAAIAGVLGKLDPYSSYISPDDLGRFRSTVDSQFGGIGIHITLDHDQLKILSPLVDTPAYRAGLEAGDSILEIDGKTTDGVSIDDAVKRLKGDAGTSVSLTVSHAGSSKKQTVAVTRELIRVETVLGDHRRDDDSWEFMLDPDRHLGYIRITGFSRETAHDLQRTLEGLKTRGLKGLILDLRFNPGGLLTSAIEISDMFISEGRIVSTQGRNTAERVGTPKKKALSTAFRWPFWSIATAPAPARLSRPVCKIISERWSSASAPGAKGACRT